LEIQLLVQRIGSELTSLQGDTTANKTSGIVESGKNGGYPKIGDNWGGFVVLRELGSGGMGSVFLADDERLGRRVALKVIRPSRLSEVSRQRFLQEATAAAKIESPYIVPIYQLGEHEGVTFIAMAHLKGSSLATALSSGSKFGHGQAVQIGIDICYGLQAAHAVDVIHRDIKPDNLWLDAKSGKIKLLDFGLACDPVADDRLTLTGQVLGTPKYMAPEQSKGKSVDHRADLFSLGCVLYQITTGRQPFTGDSTAEILINLTQYAPPAPHEIAVVDRGLSELIMSLLEKQPADRPDSASEVLNRLFEIKENEFDAAKKTIEPTTQPANNSKFGWRKVASAIAVALLAIVAYVSYQALVTIEVDSGTIKLRIDGGEELVPIKISGGKNIVVRDPNDGQAINIEIDDKRQQLRVSKNGFEVVTKAFSTELGRQSVLRVDFVSPQPALSKPVRTPLQIRDQYVWPQNATRPAIVPFDADAEQARYAKEAEMSIQHVNSLGMKFRLIPAGEFQMGADLSRLKALPPKYEEEARMRDEHFVHRTVITRPYYYASTETTNEIFFQVLPRHVANSPDRQSDELKQWPVGRVSWYDAVLFCNELSRLEGRRPCYQAVGQSYKLMADGTGYRLPTEAEFEFAYRAGTADLFPAPKEKLAEYSWAMPESKHRSHAVAKLKPNGFGLFDMGGNLWEWCHDRYVPDYYRQFYGKVAVDPLGPTSAERCVVRGGNCTYPTDLLHCAKRSQYWPNRGTGGVGFRVVLVAPK
jgi:serine/threonine protein kinase/formylglycine-generating enzyme required for sulfatase activity